jgi:exopolyphosphatase/guanosine-5'-triphosphate,3'-diphosphate pyrophosphatase
MRICAIDVGTNTVVSVVADVDGGRLRVLADEERFARLGQGVDASGRLAPEAIERALDRLAAAKATADRLGAERVVIAATSASRDARNVGVLVDRVRDELGLDYRVIPGVEEAALSFRGALALLPDVGAATVVDVGGGSTEVVTGTRAGGVGFRASLDVGSVRLTERHFSERPVTAGPARAAEADVAAALASVGREGVAGRPVVATGSVARLLARLAGAEGPAPHVPLAVVRAWRERLLALTPDETRALNPDVLTGREDVAAAAVLTLEAVVRGLGADGYTATPGGLRHGLALQAAEGGRAAA